MKKKITTTAGKRRDRPESLRQAEIWTTVKNHYLAAGLCDGCAGQAAYGAQLGFRRIKPPCDHCSYIVLPLELVARHGVRGQRWLHGEFTRTLEGDGS
jgi:hypothetical protein